MQTLLAAFVAASGALSSTSALSTDWPQYNGPAGDRSAPGGLSLEAWGEAGPPVTWRVETPTGFSSFAVEGGIAYTLVRRPVGEHEREICLAVRASDGGELWAAPLGFARYDGGGDAGADGRKGGDGPRSTPSVKDGRVFVLDAHLELHCLDARTGEPRWRRSLEREYGGRNVKWQNAASPLVEGNRVLVAGGGPERSLLAFEAETGELAWATGDELITHATPVAATIHGVRQVIFYVRSGLVALAPEDGQELWRCEYPFRTSSAASPVVHENMVYVSAGYGVGAGVFKIEQSEEGLAAELLWQQRNKLMNHWSTPVCIDGKLYGIFGFKEYGEAPLACVDLTTGDTLWSREGFGPGNVVAVDGKLVALTDAGELVIAEATPEEYRELKRGNVLSGKCWSSPSVSDGRVFVRSTEEGVCINLAAR